MYLISAYFDSRTTRILQSYIDKIAVATGNTFMIDLKVPPHITISAIEARGVEVLQPAFERLQGKVDKGQVSIVSVGQLLPYVCYATPVLNQYLQHLSQQVYDTMKDIEETSISKLYKPYSWLPHITLGKTLDKEQMQGALSCLQEHFIPVRGEIVELGLAKVNPHKDVVTIDLS